MSNKGHRTTPLNPDNLPARVNRNTKRVGALFVIIVLLAMFVRGIVRTFRTDKLGQPTELVTALGRFAAESNQGNPDIHLTMGEARDADASDDYILKRTQYVLSYNNRTHNPNWVSYNLSAWWYGAAPRHRGEFLPDPDLPSDLFHVLHRDYTNSGYDRGHMCRSEERTRNDADNLSTFYTTNLLPQTHELNAGPWLRFEEYCENICKRESKELYVIDGPLYEEDLGAVGRGVRVPSSCFKIVVVLEKGQGLQDVSDATTVVAVVMPNRHDESLRTEAWQQYCTTVREIETRSGYNFLSALPQNIQDVIENRRFTPAQ